MACNCVGNGAPFQLLQAKLLKKYLLTVAEAQKVSICKRALKWSRCERRDAGDPGGLRAFVRGKERTRAVPLWDRPGDFPSLPRFLPLAGFMI